MEIKAGTEGARRVLNAAVKGSIDILERENDDILKNARCNSGEKMSGAALTTAGSIVMCF
jgi:hypothetical protein